MSNEWNRRRLLAGVGVAAVAGCIDGSTTDLPAECPKTQGIDVEWPDELDASAVESFVEEYERVYYRDVVVEYEPESRVDSYELSGSVSEGPTEVDGGYEAAYSGGGGIYTPTLRVTATVSEAPEGDDVVPGAEVDDGALNTILGQAVQNGEADLHIESPGERVEEYIELLASLSDDFDPPSAPGDSGTLYVDVDGTTVEVEARATRFHGDYGWKAWYYVDQHVVRRTDAEEVDPRNGRLLECRNPG